MPLPQDNPQRGRLRSPSPVRPSGRPAAKWPPLPSAPQPLPPALRACARGGRPARGTERGGVGGALPLHVTPALARGRLKGPVPPLPPLPAAPRGRRSLAAPPLAAHLPPPPPLPRRCQGLGGGREPRGAAPRGQGPAPASAPPAPAGGPAPRP